METSDSYSTKKAGNPFFKRAFNAPVLSRCFKIIREGSLCVREAYSTFLAEIISKVVKL